MPPNSPYYKTPAWEKLRLQILRRDNWTCQRCGVKALGKKRNGVSPHVDHIEHRPDTLHTTPHDSPANLRTLCAKCHNQVTALERDTGKPDIGEDGFPVGSEWSQ